MAESRHFSDASGYAIELTAERWLHVLSQHQELETLESLLAEVLQHPEVIVRSVHDPQVRLYYKPFPHLWHGKYLVVVVKFERRCFILTAYITDKIKGGTKLWPSG